MISLEPIGHVRSPRHDTTDDDWGGVTATIDVDDAGSPRPNRLGATVVEIVRRSGRTLTVRGLDAIDGTPVLDIKPVMVEFLPRSPVHQPQWSRDLMRNYWKATDA